MVSFYLFIIFVLFREWGVVCFLKFEKKIDMQKDHALQKKKKKQVAHTYKAANYICTNSARVNTEERYSV